MTTTLSVVLVAIVTEIELILFSEPRIVGIHFVDEVVIVPAQLHECNSCAWMFRQFRISNISGSPLRECALSPTRIRLG